MFQKKLSTCDKKKLVLKLEKNDGQKVDIIWWVTIVKIWMSQ